MDEAGSLADVIDGSRVTVDTLTIWTQWLGRTVEVVVVYKERSMDALESRIWSERLSRSLARSVQHQLQYRGTIGADIAVAFFESPTCRVGILVSMGPETSEDCILRSSAPFLRSSLKRLQILFPLFAGILVLLLLPSITLQEMITNLLQVGGASAGPIELSQSCL